MEKDGQVALNDIEKIMEGGLDRKIQSADEVRRIIAYYKGLAEKPEPEISAFSFIFLSAALSRVLAVKEVDVIIRNLSVGNIRAIPQEIFYSYCNVTPQIDGIPSLASLFGSSYGGILVEELQKMTPMIVEERPAIFIRRHKPAK